MTDERYKAIMERLGMPNSQSLLSALQQVANEVAQETIASERAKLEQSRTSLLLTPEERNRFAAWLEHEAATSKGLIKQMEKLGAYAAPLIAREKAEAGAALVIAAKLRSYQNMEVG